MVISNSDCPRTTPPVTMAKLRHVTWLTFGCMRDVTIASGLTNQFITGSLKFEVRPSNTRLHYIILFQKYGSIIKYGSLISYPEPSDTSPPIIFDKRG